MGSLPRGDDLASPTAQPLGFSINFYGTTYSAIYISNNGYVTFDTPLTAYHPEDLRNSTAKIIAPFFADVDTRNAATTPVSWGTGTVNGHPAFGANWVNVGYYPSGGDKLNSFQLILISRSDRGAGDFDFEFNYNSIQWEAGNADNGSGGICSTSCIPPTVGYSNGLANNISFEYPGSHVAGAFLDSSTSTGLKFQQFGGSGVAGRLLFQVVNGNSGQNNTCAFSLSANSATVGAASTTGTVNVTAPASCAFTATAPTSGFATITSGANYIVPANGTSTVSYSVAGNSGSTRSTVLTIAGQSFTINQLTGCVFGLTAVAPTGSRISSASFGFSGGVGTFTVGTSSSSCLFTAKPDNPFIFLSNSSPDGSVTAVGASTVGYSVTSNNVASGRSGTITVTGIGTASGQTEVFTVVQAGNLCSYALAQSNQSFLASGGSGTVFIQAPAGCNWTAQSNTPSVVSFTSAASGSGSGSVNYSVALNSGAAQRIGRLTIIGTATGLQLPYAVTQSGVSTLNCTASVPSVLPVAIEGRTEVLGDLLLTCTGLSATLPVDVSLTLSTNVTNTIAGGTTDAILQVNGTTVQTGRVLGYNTLDWPAVSLVPTSGGTATVRLSKVRADVSLLGSAASLQSIPVRGVVNVSAAVPVPVTNGSQVLAYAGPSLVFQKQTASTVAAQTTIPLQFQEAIVNGFSAASGAAPASRLRLVMTNVPSSVQVFVPVFPSEGTARAQLFSADVNGLGGSAYPGGAGTYQQLTVTGGIATATWVVLSSDSAQFETDTFPILLQNATVQNLAQILVSGTLGPVSPVSVASTTAPVPRYRDFSVPQTLVNLRATTTATGGITPASLGNARLTPRLSTAVGSNGTFSNQVMNDDQDTPATGVTVGSKVMGGTITGCTANPGTCTFSGDTAMANVGTLPPMLSATVTVTVVPAACGSDACSVEENVSAFGNEPNADLSIPNSSSVLYFSNVTTGPTLTVSGTPQTTAVNTAFASPLQATLVDGAGSPMVNQAVTFAAPVIGASAALSSSTAFTNAAGVASVTAIANGTAGTYLVTASTAGLSGTFNLTNIPAGGDVAINQPARQSSTLPGTPPASAAVDGNTSGLFSSLSVTATNFESNPWWQVDLGASLNIGSVVVWNRTDCCASRLSDYWVFVSNTPFLDSDTPLTLQGRAGTFSSHLTTAPNPSTTISANTPGRYVRIQLNTPNYLSLAEVQVFAGSGTGATQSSTLPGTPPASAAFDGNTDGNFFNGSVTATNFESNPWWQVDLGSSKGIGNIIVWNRTDCCGSRLSDYWVFVSDTPFLATDTPATLQNRAGTFANHQTTAPNPSTSIPVSAQGRYVRVQLSFPNYLSLAEVQVVLGNGPPNLDLAQGKPATQSSTLAGTPSAAAAVDGNTNGNFSFGSVTATNLDANAWWQVDLGTPMNIGSVVVWNRTDCCASRLSDYWVFLSNTPFQPTDTPTTLQFRSATASAHLTSAPNPSASIVVLGGPYRYVRVQLSGANYLSLAEVQVFGPTNVAVGKAASQSSTLPATPPAGVAVDGNTDGNFFNGSVTATNLDNNAWWQVDLGSSVTVSSIVVWNRTDCCGSRLNDFWVFLSDSPFLATDTPSNLPFQAGVASIHVTSAPNPSTTITAGFTGRYVRVQLSGANYLSLAEVQVFGQ